MERALHRRRVSTGCRWCRTSRTASNHTSHLYEDKLLRDLRIERLKSPRAFSQQPPSRCHHLLQTPTVECSDAAANRYLCAPSSTTRKSQGDEMQFFVGTCCHHLTCRRRAAHDAQAREPPQQRRCPARGAALHLRLPMPHGPRGVQPRARRRGRRRFLFVDSVTARGLRHRRRPAQLARGRRARSSACARSMRWPATATAIGSACCSRTGRRSSLTGSR